MRLGFSDRLDGVQGWSSLSRSSSTFVVTALIAVGNLIAGVMLARALGPDGRGQLAALMVWASVGFDIGTLGTPDAIAVLTSRVVRHTSRRIALDLAMSWIPVLVSISIVTYAMLALVRSTSSEVDPTALALVGVWMCLRVLGAVLLRYVQGLGDLAGFNAARVIGQLGPLALFALVVALTDLTVTTSALAYVLAQLASVLFLTSRSRWGKSGNANQGERPARVLRWFRRFSAWNLLYVLAAKGNRSIDVLLLSLFVADEQVGLYSVAASGAVAVSLIGLSAGINALPVMSRTRSARTRSRVFRAHLLLVGALSSVAAAVGWWLAPVLIPALYGSAFEQAISIARALLLAGVAVSLSLYLSDVLRARSLPHVPAAAEVAGAAVTLLLIASNGLRNLDLVALAAAAGYWTTAGIEVVVASRTLRS